MVNVFLSLLFDKQCNADDLMDHFHEQRVRVSRVPNRVAKGDFQLARHLPLSARGDYRRVCAVRRKVIISPKETEVNCRALLREFKAHGFFRCYIYRVGAGLAGFRDRALFSRYDRTCTLSLCLLNPNPILREGYSGTKARQFIPWTLKRIKTRAGACESQSLPKPKVCGC